MGEQYSRRWLFSMHLLQLLAALAGLSAAVYYFLVTKDQEMQVPELAYFAMFGITGWLVVLGLIGLGGSLRKSRCLLWTTLVMSVPTMITALVLAAALFLLFNNLATLPFLDNLIEDAQEDLSVSMTSLAFEDPTEWEIAQDAFGCCGINAESSFGVDNIPNISLRELNTALLTGTVANCAEKLDIVVAFVEEKNTTFEASFEGQLQLLVGDDYFCSDVLFNSVSTYSLALAILSVFFAIVLLMNIVYSSVMLCYIGEEFDHEGMPAKVKLYSPEEEEEELRVLQSHQPKYPGNSLVSDAYGINNAIAPPPGNLQSSRRNKRISWD